MTQTLVLHSFIVVWNVFQVLLALFRDALRSIGTGAAAMPTARPKGSPATASNRLPRALPTILYKRLYIPIYIFTRTHTYLTFFPFHVVYSPYVSAGSVCVLPPFEPNAPRLYLRVFRKGKAFIPFVSTISLCS